MRTCPLRDLRRILLIQRAGNVNLRIGGKGRTHLDRLQVHIVVPDLEDYTDQVRKRNVVPVLRQFVASKQRYKTDRSGDSEEAAIINLIAILKSPPVSASVRPTRDEGGEDRTVVDHLNVLWLSGTDEILAPEEIHTLPSMQIQQFLCR